MSDKSLEFGDITELDKELVVVKIGSTSVVRKNVDGTVGIDSERIAGLCKSIKDLRDLNYRVLVVSSGAVAAGAQHLKVARPNSADQPGLSACAAIGQPLLMKIYSDVSAMYGFDVGQVLPMRSNFHEKDSLDKLKSTFDKLFMLGIVPIVNENDPVSTAELKFGDNDGIAALVSILLKASKFILLTDQDGILDKDPNKFKDAKLIEVITKFESQMVDNNAELSAFGSGGAGTKVAAADLASYSNSNDHVFIANSNKSAHLREILNGEIISTRVEVSRTGVLSPIDAYEVFNQLELAKQRGEAYTPIADLLNK